jgi:hypothetical protein
MAKDPRRQPQAAKDKSTERIDDIVALIVAIGRALLAKEQVMCTPWWCGLAWRRGVPVWRNEVDIPRPGCIEAQQDFDLVLHHLDPVQVRRGTAR